MRSWFTDTTLSETLRIETQKDLSRFRNVVYAVLFTLICTDFLFGRYFVQWILPHVWEMFRNLEVPICSYCLQNLISNGRMRPKLRKRRVLFWSQKFVGKWCKIRNEGLELWLLVYFTSALGGGERPASRPGRFTWTLRALLYQSDRSLSRLHSQRRRCEKKIPALSCNPSQM
jgi:hypothetical protein